MNDLSAHLFFEGSEPARGAFRDHQAVPLTAGSPAGAMRRPDRIAEEEAVHDDFYHWLFRRAGLGLEAYRTPSLRRRLPACLRAVGAISAGDARRIIERHPRMLSTAINAVLLGVTEFYRDSHVFLTLENDVLPDLIGRRGRLRVWSAACSEGQELYTVAFLLGERVSLERCELLGTDFRADAIATAAAGRYPAETASNLPPDVRDRYFTTSARTCEVHPRLRSALRWKCANLFDGVEPGPWDLVLWRNMSIYLTAGAARPLWEQIVEQISPGGYLLVGKADHPPVDARLRKVSPCVYQRSPTDPRS